MRNYGIEVTPASRAKLFRAVIVGAVATFVLFGIYMMGEQMVDMHRENRALRRSNRSLDANLQARDELIKFLYDKNAKYLNEKRDYRMRLEVCESRLNLFHLDGEINSVIYEPGDEDAAGPIASDFQEAGR